MWSSGRLGRPAALLLCSPVKPGRVGHSILLAQLSNSRCTYCMPVLVKALLA